MSTQGITNTVVCSVNLSGFEYDIHSLIKAFFPEAEVKVCIDEMTESSSEGYPDILLYFDEESISLSVTDEDDVDATRIGVAGLERAWVKNALKKLLYTALSKYTGRELPWGTLTGIRPTKIPMTLKNDGATDEEIREYMKEVYMISDEKLELACDIAVREKTLLDAVDYDNGYSLYIGIPFCPTTCLYCSFTSFPIAAWKKRVDEYLEAVFKEIDYVSDAFNGKTLDTIYIGGGTPTTLEPGELEKLLSKIVTSLNLEHLKEFTVEAGRPDSITKEKLDVLKKYGVNRISVNPQTMNQKTLDFIGRRHTVEQTKTAFELAREAGFENINMDIILGLPGEGEDEVSYTIEEIKKLVPDSLTVHSLAVKRASRLAEHIRENGMVTLTNTDEIMQIAFDGAEKLEMNPYYLYRQKNMAGNMENVGFSKSGKEGLYNILIMEEVQTIVALGAGTVTKRVYGDGRIERCDNVKDVGLYIEKIQEMIDRKRNLFSE